MIGIADCEACRIAVTRVANLVAEVRHLGSPNAEAIANVTLAYRHLEDAAMRLGKAIQELELATSVWKRPANE